MKIAKVVSFISFAFILSAANFPNVKIEFVSNGKSDILHCRLDDKDHRQFCQAGWGAGFNDVRKAGLPAPLTYGVKLAIPDASVTPVGTITAKRVLNRLQGSLNKKWKIVPELVFMLDWSVNPDCWAHGTLLTKLPVVSQNVELGQVEPGIASYNFPLTTPTNKQLWSSPNGMEIYTEFDFVDELSLSRIPAICKIEMSNVQIVLSRNAINEAVLRMDLQAQIFISQLTNLSLMHAKEIQSADAVKCVIASQLESLKAAEKLPATTPIAQLSMESQTALSNSLELTAQFTGADTATDPLIFLEMNASQWKAGCAGTQNMKVKSNPEYIKYSDQLSDLLEDAWTLSIVLKAVNIENRQLNWLIDSTIDYKLGDAP